MGCAARSPRRVPAKNVERLPPGVPLRVHRPVSVYRLGQGTSHSIGVTPSSGPLGAVLYSCLVGRTPVIALGLGLPLPSRRDLPRQASPSELRTPVLGAILLDTGSTLLPPAGAMRTRLRPMPSGDGRQMHPVTWRIIDVASASARTSSSIVLGSYTRCRQNTSPSSPRRAGRGTRCMDGG